MPQFELEQSEVIRVSSRLVGDEFDIYIAHPKWIGPVDMRAPRPPRILYALDPYWFYGTFVETSRIMQTDTDLNLEPLLVVSIGYPRSDAIERQPISLRMRDLLPPGTSVPHWIDPYLGVAVPEAGADKFLRFIEEELDPEIRSRYAVSPSPAMLAGHSYAGLFASYALLKQSPAFSHYLIMSPGFFDLSDPTMAGFRGAKAAGVPLKGKVYLVRGEHEGRDSGTHHSNIGLQMDELEQLFMDWDCPDLELKIVVAPDETHNTIPGAAFSKGYKWLLSGAKLGE